MNDLFKVLLYGPGGSGKTVSSTTAIKCLPSGGKLVYLMTERNSLPGIIKGIKIHKLKLTEGQLIYSFPKDEETPFKGLHRVLEGYTKISKTQSLRGNPDSTQNKQQYSYLLQILDKLVNYEGTDFVTNSPYSIGNISALGENDILVIDGLSPISHYLKQLVLGDKYIAISLSDYMPVQAAMLSLFKEFEKIPTNLILLAHDKPVIENITDSNGKIYQKETGKEIMTGVGSANYQQLLGCMTDVIYSRYALEKYKWVTKGKVTTICRTIKPAIDLEPDFELNGFKIA